ncbi:hypothetical protein [Flavobacterium sp. NKUCC04_CG]|uniref:hypothetical protein n=1 Tax=Flavobacterium sp. NKUCC04_CG TaxID=2842121 RepID=UPI001C5B3A5A|nr:hypothetical protein [Flavobacterium sp. NKUCC04_CG]MBW3519497.1 hypothetical protein [Flavobacterium sp. NKUCC04_CG]
MKHIEIPEVQRSLYIPENLMECNGLEYVKICHHLYEFSLGHITYEDFKVRAITELLGYRFHPKKSSKSALENLCLLSSIMEGYFEDYDGAKQIKLDFIDLKIRHIKSFYRKFYSPGEVFQEMIYGQYADASRLFLQYSQTQDEELLYLITAILYLRKKEVYNSNLIEAKASILKSFVSKAEIYGVYLQFAAFQKYITSAEVEWGNQQLDFSIIFDVNEVQTEKIPGLGADAIIFTLAETGVFGTVKQVRKSKFWEVILRMYDLRKRDLDYQNLQNVENK